MNLNITSGLRTVKSLVTANSPVLLTGAAVAGAVATAVLAAKAGYKARGIVVENERAKGAELELREKVELTWLCYAAPAVSATSTACAALGIHMIHSKRNAALAGLYAITANKLDDFRDAAEARLGPKKIQEINDYVAQTQLERCEEDGFVNNEIVDIGPGEENIFFEWAGRWCKGNINTINAAINSINKQLNEEGDATLNDFYDAVGLPPTPQGEDFGWSGSLIEPRFGSTLLPDGRSAVSFTFHKTPKPLASFSR